MADKVVSIETGEEIDPSEAATINPAPIPTHLLGAALADLNESLGSPEPDWETLNG